MIAGLALFASYQLNESGSGVMASGGLIEFKRTQIHIIETCKYVFLKSCKAIFDNKLR
jgi:hypothetical protein